MATIELRMQDAKTRRGLVLARAEFDEGSVRAEQVLTDFPEFNGYTAFSIEVKSSEGVARRKVCGMQVAERFKVPLDVFLAAGRDRVEPPLDRIVRGTMVEGQNLATVQ